MSQSLSNLDSQKPAIALHLSVLDLHLISKNQEIFTISHTMQWLSLPLISEVAKMRGAQKVTLYLSLLIDTLKFTSAAFSVRYCNMASFLMNVF